MKRFLIAALAAILLLSSCATAPDEPKDNPDNPQEQPEQPPEDINPPAGDDTQDKPQEDDMKKQQLLEALALCITEGSVPLDRTSVNSRFADYKALGLRAVRLDLYWTNQGGKAVLQDQSKYQFEAAKKNGLLIKAIINPGGTTNPDPDSKLMDADGRAAINAISPWYADVESYTEQHIRTYLGGLVQSGYKDIIGGIVAGLGPAGEPLYPPAWTQGAPLTNEVMWCYADNAQADFRAEMEQKYSSIAKANAAWGKNYADFDDVQVPKEGEVKGQMWRDVLEWYRDSKREFMRMQVETFRRVMKELGMDDVPLILYLPGADFTKTQWESCVSIGAAINGIKFMCDNEFTVQLADEFDCILQYTGITGVEGLRHLRNYMFENGYAHIPVMGENAGGSKPDAQAKLLYDVITEYKLWGIDYTHSHWLFETDGKTHSDMYAPFESIVPKLADYLKTVDITVPNENKLGTAAPEGDVLAYKLSFNKPASEAYAFAFATIAQLNFEVQDGDLLEYDVYLSDDMSGIGAIDGTFDGGRTMRDSFNMTDTLGVRVHPNADLSNHATGAWYYRVIRLGNAASDGAVLQTLQLAAHPEAQYGAFTQIDVTVYYDNIVITRDGEVVKYIFENKGDVTLAKATLKQYAEGEVKVVNVYEVE